ncbi:MAG: tRNA (N6-threonylcarbamoyladenosine(37)-N6)-methyltransferase TrmO, partial [Planctomycetes bacterium]|nr:tRNA (N6-threonylcarbamoyladenosine(37)-N6)-methyltransferase TrmO [Planctomycetota bacterium]
MGKELCIDATTGIAGDMFSAALVALGAPADRIVGVMMRTGQLLGRATIGTETVEQGGLSGIRLAVQLQSDTDHLAGSEARRFLDQALRNEKVSGGYAEFARRTLEILLAAEREAHSGKTAALAAYQAVPVGMAHTPYESTAPSQPTRYADGAFSVEIFPEFSAGLKGLETFSHLYILSYLHRSPGWSLTVTPPWQHATDRRRVGLFASRSPNRPSPIGLTLTELRGIDRNCIITGPLDLFNGTPVLDVKPHVSSVDEKEVGNDGWLAGTEHLLLHQRGVPHRHSSEEPLLHEAADIILDILGAAVGMQCLNIAPETAVCLTPLAVGGGEVRCSHGVLQVPAPATMAILKKYRVPQIAGPVDVELLTPTGAALLASLGPQWRPRELGPPRGPRQIG